MKKVSLLVLISMLLCLVLTACDEIHTHTYGNDWSFDATNHYHVCACGEKNAVAAHADADNDGACDTCAIIMANEHVFDKAWSSDATDHWHAALCGHDKVADKAAHTEPDALGKCTVCGYLVSAPVVETIEDALALAEINAAAVKYGYINAVNYYEEFDINANETFYEFGENYLHYAQRGGYNYYITLGEDDEVFALRVDVSEYGTEAYIEEATADWIKGPAFDGEIIGDELSCYGALDLIGLIYEKAANDANMVETVGEDNTYSFKFARYDGWYYYYETEVVFKLDAETYMLTNLDITTLLYTDVVTEGEGDNVTYKLAEGAEVQMKKTLEVIQSTEVFNNYTPVETLPLSYKLTDEEGTELDLTQTITVELTTFANEYSYHIIKVADVENMNEFFNSLADVKVTDAEGNDTWLAYATYSYGEIMFRTNKAGSYKIVFNVAGIEKIISINVEYATPTEIAAGVYSGEDLNEQVGNKEITTGSSITIGAVVGFGYDPAFTAEITSDNKADATLANGVFTSNVAGTYVITLTSTANAEATATLTVVVSDPNAFNPAEALNGSYVAVEDDWYTLVFTPETATTGTAVGNNGYNDTVFSYVYEDGALISTYVSGDQMAVEKFYLNANNEIVMKLMFNPTEYVMQKVGGSGPSVPSDAEPIVLGADMSTSPSMDYTTDPVTYVATLEAGAIGWIYFGSQPTAYVVTVEVIDPTGNVVALWEPSPKLGTKPFDSTIIDAYGSPSSADVWFQNYGTEAVTFTFTVTYSTPL